MSFQPSSVLLLLALIGSDATHDHRSAGEQTAPASEGASRDVSLTDASEPVCIFVGQALRVHLPASAAMGEGWVLEGSAPLLLRLNADPGGAATSLLRAVRASKQAWEFRAQRSGRAALRFVTWRRVELGHLDAHIVDFDVVVRDSAPTNQAGCG